MIENRTRNDLVNEALMNLGVLAAGQSPDAEDFAAVDGKYNALIARLETQDILDIDNSIAAGEIPAELFAPLAVLLADDSALEFGLPGVPPSQSNPQPVAAAIDQIRLITYGRPTYQPQRTEYF
jgi:hypothetical protein